MAFVFIAIYLSLHVKTRGPDAAFRGGVGHIFICTDINFHSRVKQFKMGGYWSVMKRSIFLFDHRMCESWDFGPFSKKFDKKWTLEVADLVKKLSKNSKKMMKNLFLYFCFYYVLLNVLCSPDLIQWPKTNFTPAI